MCVCFAYLCIFLLGKALRHTCTHIFKFVRHQRGCKFGPRILPLKELLLGVSHGGLEPAVSKTCNRVSLTADPPELTHQVKVSPGPKRKVLGR